MLGLFFSHLTRRAKTRVISCLILVMGMLASCSLPNNDECSLYPSPLSSVRTEQKVVDGGMLNLSCSEVLFLLDE